MDEMAAPATAENKAPAMRFNHLGLVVKDIELMEDYYVRVLGFTISDKGDSNSGPGTTMVFMTLDPTEHHQIFLVEGRPDGIPANTHMPQAGAMIHHLSFRLEDLSGLHQMHGRLRAESDREIRGAFHGNCWSIYTTDPEGNSVEFFVDTPWYCYQPFYRTIDFEMPEDELFRTTKEMVENAAGFKSHEAFKTELAERLA